jgi:DNA repair protein SbcD/Mre11
MKFLHTADWHLGRRLHGQDLADEQEAALNEILRLLREHRVDALIHAGDVFDSGNPPQAALKLYYSFLTRAVAAGCATIVITGGNHDSPAALNAPKDLLKAMNVYVVGGATDDITDEIIPIRNADRTTLGYCCAVPFLRDKDLRYSMPGESDAERSKRIVAGIREHYDNIFEKTAQAAQILGNEKLPIIATGHLFAQGGITGDLDNKEQIHVGNLGQIGSDAFPAGFAYVALGHLHRPQIVGKQGNEKYGTVRYSGSPVALDFSERSDEKQVFIVECLPEQPASVLSVTLPTFRRLVRFSGTVAEIEQTITTLDTSTDALPTFAEVHVAHDSNAATLDANEHFRTLAEKQHGERMQILRVVQERALGTSAFGDSFTASLEELSRDDVFAERLKKSGLEGSDADDLRRSFAELLTLLDEGELAQ